MRFILFVEGHTEKGVIPEFLKRWLDPKLPKPVGIRTVRFDGWAELVKNSSTKADLYLRDGEVIAVIALLDLYGPTFYPGDATTSEQRYEWAKPFLEGKVGRDNFFQFFAVHEVEAWLLSDPNIFPKDVRPAIEKLSSHPESVNGQEPPAKHLDRIYKKATKRRYKKVVHGKDLFGKLDPNAAYKKCPHLKKLLDAMLKLATDAAKPTPTPQTEGAS
ncbi:MAG: DUF4276 family protein [Deltaproteobacteria bacterium]|nr:DUF4276 family protein [Deltaproteobacteria bacterium]